MNHGTRATASSEPTIDLNPGYFPVNRSIQVSDPSRGRRGVPPPPASGVGLGDVVTLAARWTGIHWMIQRRARRTGKPCGCAARRKRLNRIRFRLPVSFRG